MSDDVYGCKEVAVSSWTIQNYMTEPQVHDGV